MKITFTATDCVSSETLERNRQHSLSLGLPMLGRARAPYLAVVGGGPSVSEHVEELRDWPGVIWAINGAFKWLRDRGVLSQFYTLDPKMGIADLCREADSAVMSTRCAPEAFAAMYGAYIELVDLEDKPAGPTSAASAPYIAAQAGFRQVHMFGCEGNFGDETHVYGTPRDTGLLEVVCNGLRFRTSPQMLMQTEYLADIMRETPQFCIDRSGGLLAACIADPDIDVTAASRSIYNKVMAA